jgi:molybdate transport system ATP-binding protein
MIHVDIEQQLGRFHLAAKFSADAPVVGLFGPSGAGKSTVINAIAGIAKPSRGSIRVNGLTLFDAAKGIDVPPDKRRIGYVFQDALLFPHLDVESNLLYGLRLRSTMERFIEPPRVIDLLGLKALLRRATRTCQGEKSNASQSDARCSPSRAFCSWMNPWPHSMCRARRRFSTISSACATSSAFPSSM